MSKGGGTKLSLQADLQTERLALTGLGAHEEGSAQRTGKLGGTRPLDSMGMSTSHSAMVAYVVIRQETV